MSRKAGRPEHAPRILFDYIREQKGITRTELAKKAGVSAVSITNWARESTNPFLNSACGVAKALGYQGDMSLLFEPIKDDYDFENILTLCVPEPDEPKEAPKPKEEPLEKMQQETQEGDAIALFDSLREKQGLSRIGLSLKTGISEASISNFAHGSVYPRIDDADLIARALHFEGDIRDLFRLTGTASAKTRKHKRI